MLEYVNTEWQGRLKVLSQNEKVSKVKQAIKKVLFEDKSLAEQICTLFLEKNFTVVLVLTVLSMAISTIVLAITGSL